MQENKLIDKLLNGGYCLPCKSAKKKDIAILLFHGFASSPKELYPLAEFLSDNYDIYAPRLPGHGTSIKDLEKRKYTEWLSFSARIYKHLRSQYKKVVLIGFSMGGTIALYLSTKYRPHKLITISAPVSVFDIKFIAHRIKENWRKSHLTWYKIIQDIKIALNETDKAKKSKSRKVSYVVNDLYKRFIEYNLCHSKSILLKKYFDTYTELSRKSLRQLLSLIHYVHKFLSKTAADILVIHSENDTFLSIDNANIILSSAKSSTAEKYIVSKSHHNIILDIEHKSVYKKIRQFIEES